MAKIPKPLEERVRDLEAHLYFLGDALNLYPEQLERFKQIASELRVLVCEIKRTNHPLLLDLMDEFGFEHNVQPPSEPPFSHLPIYTVGWNDEPGVKELNEELTVAVEDPEKLEVWRQKMIQRRKPLSFREYVNKGLALVVLSQEYSFRDLTRAIAEQMGSSHEDKAVEESLAQLKNILIGGHQGHIGPLVQFGNHVLVVGIEFINFLKKNHGFIPKYFIQ